jgi:Uma2 family endonuclease
MGRPEPTKRLYAIGEYLRLERDALEKHEYRDGQILLMAGGTINHSLIVANVIREIGNLLAGKPCRVFDSNLRVGVPRKVLYTYPDVTVICGRHEPDPNDDAGETINNPRLIVEVLSPSTEGYDRGEKFNRYLQLASLQEYVLVSQNVPRVETYFRQADGTWLFTPVSGLEAAAKLRTVEIELPLAGVYAGVEFPPEDPPPAEGVQRPRRV